MSRLKIVITWKRVPDRTDILDARNIDRSALARVMTRLMQKDGVLDEEKKVTRENVQAWLHTKRIPAKYIKYLRLVNLGEVKTFRKVYKRVK